MKNEYELESDLVQAIVAEDTEGKLTFFGQSGVLKSIIRAIAQELAEIYHDIHTTRQKLSYLTAAGDDLDARGAEDGTDRLAASAAGTFCVVTGTIDTVIPAGSRVRSTTGVIFETTQEVIIGSQNPDLNGASVSLGLGTKAGVVAQETGIIGNVPRGSITEIIDTVAGWEGVTNPLPVTDGEDQEQDVHYRYRAIHRVALLTKSTKDYYLALAQEADERVLRVFVEPGGSGRSVKLHVFNRTGVGFQSAALSAIQSYIEDRSPDLLSVNVINGTFVDISPEIDVVLADGYTLEDAYVTVADALVQALPWKTWTFVKTVRQEDLIAAASGVDALQDMKVSTFLPAQDILVEKGQLPKLGGLTLQTTTQQKTANLVHGYGT